MRCVLAMSETKQLVRRKLQKEPSVRIQMRVLGPFTAAQSRFFVHGHPNQTVRWLALACSQRLLLKMPHGAKRNRELERFRDGLIRPAGIKLPNGKLLDPMSVLKDVFKSGDQACLVLNATFDDRCALNSASKRSILHPNKPDLSVSRRREPTTTSFLRRAFVRDQPTMQAWGSNSSRQVRRPSSVEPIRPSTARVRSRSRQLQERIEYEEKTDAAKFRNVMSDQQTFGNMTGTMTEEEAVEYKKLVLLREFELMAIHLFVPIQSEQDELLEVFAKDLAHLNDIFRYYSGAGHGGTETAVGGNTATMR